ncbi:CHAD domain-containing protein [Aerococcaceae bacterium DSM 111020]|nr:CHAD domain-containing protein [Aerococcaceae bacterium DSM 111020]
MLIDPVDVESVHQLRVSIRKFRALISLAKPHMDYDSYLLIQDYFRQRGRELADLREMDVLIDWTGQIEGLKDSEIIQRLKAMRIEEQEEVLKLLDEAYVQDLRKNYQDFLDLVKASVNSNFTEAFEDRVQGWDQYIMKKLPEIDDLEWAKIHRVRIKSKKARYVCDIFADDIDPDYANRKKEYKQIQSDLGVRCDQLRNLEAIDEWIKDDSPQIIEEKAIFKKATEAMGQEGAMS